jgi:cation transporter-like permease
MAAEQMEQLWCDELDTDGDMTCPVEPTISFGEALRDRAYWLVGLLALQSCSGFILSRNEVLLANHPVIIYFLTMLVGAGGNAGNQASVRGKSCFCIALVYPIQTCVSHPVLAVIRGLALGTLNERTQGQFLSRELKMAGALSGILSLAGFARAAVFRTPFAETIAVTSALMLIVFSSICLGAVLPLFLKKLGVDPAHSSTTIQVRHATHSSYTRLKSSNTVLASYCRSSLVYGRGERRTM